jgi:NAD-dependent dihydropyrimidine dehydrogenase PreA subunit/bacterioferritin-associated ferredoxin
MKVVNVQAKVNMEICKICKTCERVCPVYAIEILLEKGAKPRVEIDLAKCVGCWNCQQRCPEYAIEMVSCEPFTLATDVSAFDYQEITRLCRKAHFHPKQLVCYCTATRAEEMAAAVLAGARSPDALVRATGAGSGCGIECNQPIVRFLEAANIPFERKKDSYQWYGRTMTAWEVPDSVKAAFPGFRFEGDRELFDRIVDAPVRRG